MSDLGYWKSEYDWEILAPRSKSKHLRETVLSVVLDNGAQRQFSSVRITLLCSDSVIPKHRKTWQITPLPSSLSVVDRTVTESQDKPVTQNDSSLPTCNIVFMVDQHSGSACSKTVSDIAKGCWEILLVETGFPMGSSSTILEVNHPLTENTQSVSVSFTSSYLLRTSMSRGILPRLSLDDDVKIGRVVRVFPVVPINERRTISLPVDVLLFIFSNLRFPLTHRNWRKDILSCALVCREWTCALNLMLIDFRSEDSQQGHPPEIVSFADALVARPSLGLVIKYISAGYLDKHPAWDPHPILPSGRPSPSFMAMFRSLNSDSRRAQFSDAFVSILRVAKNVQTLRLNPGKDLIVSPDDLADALQGLNQLQTFKGRCPLSMARFVACLAAWPSLKRLSILKVLPPGDLTVPLIPPSCCLTEIELVDVPIQDNEFTCLVSASGATLERLSLNRISRLTNAGLGAALNVVCASLKSLYIMSTPLARAPDEEHALDAMITRMVRLTTLEIVLEVASERMVKRRSDAFEQRTAPALTEVHLHLMIGRGSEACDLVGAANRSWPGWKIRS